MLWLLTTMACDVLFIKSETYESLITDHGDLDDDGYSVAEGDCDDSVATTNPNAYEEHGNGIDDNCDGLIDPGNGTAFFKFNVENEEVGEEDFPYLEFYWQAYEGRPVTPDTALPKMLVPVEDWEFSFLFVRPSPITLDSDEYYFLLGKNDINLGYKTTNSGVDFVYEVGDSRVMVEVPNMKFENDTAITFTWSGADILQDDGDCSLDNLVVSALVDGFEVGSPEVNFDGSLEDFCYFYSTMDENADDFPELLAPVNFGGREEFPSNFQPLGAMVDDIVLVQGLLTDEERLEVVEQILEPPLDFNGTLEAYDLPDIDNFADYNWSPEQGRRFSWVVVDDHNTCNLTDRVGRIDAKIQGYCKDNIHY